MIKKLLLNILIFISTSFLIIGCSSTTTTKVITNKNYQTLCSPLELKKDDELIVKFPSSQFSGYKWQLEKISPDILSLITNKIQRDETPESRLHREETVWQFKANQPGTTTLSFRYQLDWDTNVQESQQVQCTVTVLDK